MALGFRDCCNNYSYFYLSDTPTFVSEGEVYFIITDYGDTFCAQYVTVPSLNYSPSVYSVNEMTQFSTCDSCISSHACPTVDPINQIGELATITVNECVCKTQFPLVVNCVSVNPTFDNTNNGTVGISFTGGQPPYKVFKQINGDYILVNTYTQQQQSGVNVYTNADEGTYYMKLIDGNGDEVFLNCVLNAPPAPMTISSNVVNPNFHNASNGSVTFTIGGGTSPYFVTYDGDTTTVTNNSFVIPNISANTYSISVTDSATGLDSQTVSATATLNNPAELTYPDNLCLSVTYCGNILQLVFNKTSEYFNLRPKYTLNNNSKSAIGYLTTDTFELYFDTNNKWTTGLNTINTQTIGSLFNQSCQFGAQPSIGFEMTPQNPLTSVPQTGLWSSKTGSYLVTNNTTINVTPSNVCPVIIVGSVTDACGSVNNGSVTISVVGGGTPPFTYYKNGALYGSNPTISNLNSGTYTFYVIDGNGTQSNTLNLTVASTQNTQIGFNNNCVSFSQPTGSISSGVITQTFGLSNSFNSNVDINGQLVINVTFDRYIPTDSGISDPYNTVFLIPPSSYNLFIENSQDIILTVDDPYQPVPITSQAQGEGFGLPQCDYGKYTTQYDLFTNSINYHDALSLIGSIPLQYGISGSYIDSNGNCPIYIKITVTALLQSLTINSPQCSQINSMIQIGNVQFLFIDTDNNINGTEGEYQTLVNTNPCPQT